MKLTSGHLRFYRRKKINPSWSSDISQEPININSLINSQVEKPRDDFKLSNTITLLKAARKSKRLIDCLTDCSHSSEKVRAKFASKWLKRIKKDQNNG